MGRFKRIKEGITTKTHQKKKLLMGFGTNVQSVKQLSLQKNINRILIVVLIVITILELAQKNILNYYLITINLLSLMQT